MHIPVGKRRISFGAQKEAELKLLYQIVNYVQKYQIPCFLILNFDQTLLKYVEVSSMRMGKGEKPMFQSLVLMTNNQSLLQLIFKSKTNESLLKVTFPEEFSLSANEKNYSNEKESLKFLDEFILSYIQQKQKNLGLENQKALIIYDVFCAQTTDKVLKLLDNNILVIKVPPNMT